MTSGTGKRRAKLGSEEAPTGSGRGTGRRVAWFHCFSGIAGDMALGSLVDAGADPTELEHMLDRLPIDGWSLNFEPVLRNGIAATQAVVKVRDDAVVRTFPHVMAILEEARLPERVRGRATAAFSLLATVEGRLHRRPMSQVLFPTRRSSDRRHRRDRFGPRAARGGHGLGEPRCHRARDGP